MKFKALLVLLLVACTLAGCSALGQASPTPLPTVVLGNNNGAATPQAASQPNLSGVTASGVVVPAQQAQIASSMAGTLAAVNVAVGDQVKAGQVLVRLAGSEKLAAAIESANLELLSAQQVLKTLNDNADQARSAAQLRLADAQKALDDAQKRRAWKQYRNGSQSDIDAAQADLVLANDAVKNAEDAFNQVADRSETDVLRAGALSALSAARKARDRSLANLNYLLALPSVIDVNQAEAELRSAQTEVENAQKDYDKLKDGPDPDALALADERIKNAQAQLAAGQSDLANLELKAPFDGTVTQVNLHTGEWTVPGQPVLALADLANLRVETTDLSERDVPQVAVGQPVTVMIKALNQDVNGHVSDISPLADTLGGDVVYKTTIALDKLPPGLRPGMTVEVQFGSSQ
jgi:HlyD family secretion protein